jgi:hypothetical protein
LRGWIDGADRPAQHVDKVERIPRLIGLDDGSRQLVLLFSATAYGVGLGVQPIGRGFVVVELFLGIPDRRREVRFTEASFGRSWGDGPWFGALLLHPQPALVSGQVRRRTGLESQIALSALRTKALVLGFEIEFLLHPRAFVTGGADSGRAADERVS